jgi:hypothetical protein
LPQTCNFQDEQGSNEALVIIQKQLPEPLFQLGPTWDFLSPLACLDDRSRGWGEWFKIFLRFFNDDDRGCRRKEKGRPKAAFQNAVFDAALRYFNGSSMIDRW